MKKILLSSVALLGLTAGALAADLPSRRVAPAPYVAVPVFTWTGFYVGVNAGYGFTDNDNRNNYFAGAGYYGNGDNSRDGFVGGGQIGYNYQMGNWVIGIEADAQYADLGGRNNNYAGLVGYGYGNQGIDWFGTVRGRVGYAWDRLLVYGTGGFAYGGSDNDNNNYYGAGYAYGNRSDDIRTGWAAGGGVEYAFTPNLTGKIEGLYVSLDRNTNNYYYGGVVPAAYYGNGRHNDDNFAVVRAGLNYKFSLF